MNEPIEARGDETASPIAGDPSSFPADAELARTLIAANRRAMLATITADGFPFGSVVSYAADESGRPVVAVSTTAEHTLHAVMEDRASLLVVDGGDDDPLERARVTVVGRIHRVDASMVTGPAGLPADGVDVWRLEVESVRFVDGSNRTSIVTAEEFRAAEVDPLAEIAGPLIEQLNDAHRDDNLMYVRVLAGLEDAFDATMLGIDRYGITLSAETHGGRRLVRVPFEDALHSPDQARSAVIELLEDAVSRYEEP
ncbi:MAG: DUF2470 domain-containing protein [Actinomycetota bacterium]